MNPGSSEIPGLQPLVPEQVPDIDTSAESEPAGGSSGPERGPSALERAGNQAKAAAAAQQPVTLPLPPVIKRDVTQNDDASTTPPSAQQQTDDDDLIEKEWVNKAKQIVEANRNDPYKQSEELTIFRADYMKKHYGKNIKLSK